jgi:hypothetical protein
MTDSFEVIITQRAAAHRTIASCSCASWPPILLDFHSRSVPCSEAPRHRIVAQWRSAGLSESPHCSPSFNLFQLQIQVRRLLSVIYCYHCHLSGHLPAEIVRRARLRSEFPKVKHKTLSHDIEKWRRNTAAYVNDVAQSENRKEVEMHNRGVCSQQLKGISWILFFPTHHQPMMSSID